ncbi:GD19565 [Drosophila simulans]|uniref:GD19565 n=1 Tax=Drosophila simulans TaxID=7240 RepID=B4QXN1_DROSI|nr:GD19565 [Drosophila simulans]
MQGMGVEVEAEEEAGQELELEIEMGTQRDRAKAVDCGLWPTESPTDWQSNWMRRTWLAAPVK